MSLEIELNHVLDVLLTTGLKSSISKEHLIQSMDLTLLNEQATSEALDNLLKQAAMHPVAAICIFPNHLSQCKLADAPTRLATVINFPQGNESISQCTDELERASALGADEIDYVFPYQIYLSNNKAQALEHCSVMAQECKKRELPLKVILETSAYPDLLSIYQASVDIIKLGVDFLKTSTGKSKGGTTLSAAFAMLCAIKDSDSNCGIKISGGIKSFHQALNYARLAELIRQKPIDASWFRIGASGLLNDM